MEMVGLMALLAIISQFLLPHGIPKMPTQPFCQLSDKTLIAKGTKRECHQHPDYTDRCIKVPRPGKNQQSSIVEFYCLRTMARRGVSFRHCIRCHGWVATSLGPGLVLDWVREENGEPALLVENYARRYGLSQQQIEAMLVAFERWMMANAVPINDASVGNFMVRHWQGKPHLVLIDGLGSERVKFNMVWYRRFKWFARYRSCRRWPVKRAEVLDTVCALGAPEDSSA